MRSDLPRQVWHDAEPPGQIWHDPEPDQAWQQLAQPPPQTLRLRPGDGYESADGPRPDQRHGPGTRPAAGPHDRGQGARGNGYAPAAQHPPGYGPASGPVEPDPMVGYHGGYEPTGGYVHDDRGQYPSQGARAGRADAVTAVTDHGRPPVQARLTGRSDPVVCPCATRGVAMATQVMTVIDAQTTDRARGRVMALLTVMAPRLATAHRAGQPELTAPTSVAGRLDQTACGPLPGRAGPRGTVGSRDEFRAPHGGRPDGHPAQPSYDRRRDYAGQQSYAAPHDIAAVPGRLCRPARLRRSARLCRPRHYAGPRDYAGPHEYGGPAGYDEPDGYQQRGRFAAAGGVPDAGYGPEAGRVPPGTQSHQAGNGHPGGQVPPGYGPATGPDEEYGPINGRLRRAEHGRPPGYGGQEPHGLQDGYDPSVGYEARDGFRAPGQYGPKSGQLAPDGYGRPRQPGRPNAGRQPETRGAAGGFRMPEGQAPRRRGGTPGPVGAGPVRQPGAEPNDGYWRRDGYVPEWQAGSGGSDGHRQAGRPQPGYRPQSGYGHGDGYAGGAGDWPPERHNAPAGYQREGYRQRGGDWDDGVGGFQGPADRDRDGRSGWGPQGVGQSGPPPMPADPPWQNQAGQLPQGPGRTAGGYGRQGPRRARPWPPDGTHGYPSGGPAPQAYVSETRDGYATDDVRYPNQPRGYPGRGGPVPDEQGFGGDRRHGGASPGPRDGRGQPDGNAGQAARAGKTGQKRRTGPPAALPPGSSAAGTQAAGPGAAPAGSNGHEPAAHHGRKDERGLPAGVTGTADPAQSQRATDAVDSPGSKRAGEATGPDASAPAANATKAQSADSAPPSPTGTIPPAVIDVPNPAPPAKARTTHSAPTRSALTMTRLRWR